MTFAERSTKKDSNDNYNTEIGKNNMQNNCDNGDDSDCYTKIFLAQCGLHLKKRLRKRSNIKMLGIK